jgi:hypothetical protein
MTDVKSLVISRLEKPDKDKHFSLPKTFAMTAVKSLVISSLVDEMSVGQSVFDEKAWHPTMMTSMSFVPLQQILYNI